MVLPVPKLCRSGHQRSGTESRKRSNLRAIDEKRGTSRCHFQDPIYRRLLRPVSGNAPIEGRELGIAGTSRGVFDKAPSGEENSIAIGDLRQDGLMLTTHGHAIESEIDVVTETGHVWELVVERDFDPSFPDFVDESAMRDVGLSVKFDFDEIADNH